MLETFLAAGSYPKEVVNSSYVKSLALYPNLSVAKSDWVNLSLAHASTANLISESS